MNLGGRTDTSRSSKKTPNNEEIVDDFLKTLIAGAKFYVAVKIEGSSGEAVASTSKRKAPEPEGIESIGELQLGVDGKTFPSKEAILKSGGTFWIYVSDISGCSFIYFEVDKTPGYLITDLRLNSPSVPVFVDVRKL